MTFMPGQVMTTEDWLKKHEGHEIVDRVDEYPFDDGAVKKMHFRKCVPCGHQHYYKTETVEWEDL